MANRKKHKILNESISFEVNLNDSNSTIDSFVKDTSNNPENILISMENKRELLDSIEKSLTKLELEVLQFKLDGFDYKEIAEIINKDAKSVDNAIQRIKAKIKKILNEIEE